MKHLPDGMYQQGSSVIHRLDATIKLILLILLIVSVIVTDTLAGYGVLILFTLIIVILSRISFQSAIGSAIRLIWFFIIIFIMNLCFYSTDKAWISLWIFNPSYSGMMQGIKVVVRVFIILVLSNILNVTTAPIAVTGAIENVLSPLRLFKIPTRQLSLILSVAIQFIPTLFEEADLIRKAQLSRGARFDSKSLFDKAKAVVPLVVPIFVSAFRRADELSLAMEARGYRVDVSSGAKHFIHFGVAETVSLILCIALCVLQIIVF